MINDGTLYLRMSDNDIIRPEEVFPFDHHRIKLFSCEMEGKWRVTCAKTGYLIGELKDTREDAENSAKMQIDFITPTEFKKRIQIAVDKTSEGLQFKDGAWVEY
jgi:hypothetical protein